RLAFRVVVEVLVPEEVIDDDEVAFLPAVMLTLVGRSAHEAVAMAFDDIKPRFAGMAVERLRLARRELDHDLRDAGGFAADRAIDEELGARAARRGEEILLVVGRVDAAVATLARFIRDSAQPARIRIVALRPLGESRSWRERLHVLVAAILDHAHAEGPLHRLRGVAREARRLRAVVAASMPGPCRNV